MEFLVDMSMPETYALFSCEFQFASRPGPGGKRFGRRILAERLRTGYLLIKVKNIHKLQWHSQGAVFWSVVNFFCSLRYAPQL